MADPQVSAELQEMIDYHNDTVAALTLFLETLVEQNDLRFLGIPPQEVRRISARRIAETETRSSLALLAAVEAAFRIDYRLRITERKKDALSRACRNYAKGASRIRLDDLLSLWGPASPGLEKVHLRPTFFTHSSTLDCAWAILGRAKSWKVGLQQHLRSKSIHLISFPFYRYQQ